MVEVDKQQDVLSQARDIFAASPDWITFYREILGLRGVVRRYHPTPESLSEFEQTEVYAEIQEMLTRLRERAIGPAKVEEPTRVITVRLPKCLHDALKREAHEHQTSMNKLCISKLLQIIDGSYVPSDTQA
jgi:predicted HicB family RNase H-like nuclease